MGRLVEITPQMDKISLRESMRDPLTQEGALPTGDGRSKTCNPN